MNANLQLLLALGSLSPNSISTKYSTELSGRRKRGLWNERWGCTIEEKHLKQKHSYVDSEQDCDHRNPEERAINSQQPGSDVLCQIFGRWRRRTLRSLAWYYAVIKHDCRLFRQ